MSWGSVTTVAGFAVAASAVLIELIFWPRFYANIKTKNEINRNDYRRFIIWMSALGLWHSIGWALAGIGMVEDSPRPNPLPEYSQGMYCFGGGAAIWLLMCLAMLIYLIGRFSMPQKEK